MKRALILLVVCAAAAVIPAAAAQAHATLEATSPQRGSVVMAAPDRVVLRFDEPVDARLGGVRVFDGHGERADDGATTHPGGRGAEVAVGLKDGLADGSYTATYRVISADGHPVSGGFVFSIGREGAGPARTVSELLAGSRAGPVTEVAFGLARGMNYAAIALLIGGLVFAWWLWRPGVGDAALFTARLQRLLLWAVALAALATAAGLVLQGAVAGGTSFWSALRPGVLGDVLDTRFGAVWVLRLVDWLLVAALLTVGSRLPRAVIAVPLAFLLVTPALSGHATTQHPVALLAPLDVAHVLAMSVWVGGLVVLVGVVPAVTRRLAAPDRTRLLAGVLSRFSPLALGCVVVLALTGTWQAVIHLTALGDLTGTAFGRAVLVKIVLLLALVVLGALNLRRTVPRLRALAAGGRAAGADGLIVRRTLRAEVALLAVVLGVTSALVAYPPPTAMSAGPYSASHTTGPVEVELTVDPARPGPNTVHVYAFRASDGAPLAETKEVTVTARLASKGIGPLTATVHRAGPGHYLADALVLAPRGTWRVDVAVRVSAFDEYTTTFSVPVR